MIGGTMARELVCGRCGEGFRLLTDPGAAEWITHPTRADGSYCGGFAATADPVRPIIGGCIQVGHTYSVHAQTDHCMAFDPVKSPAEPCPGCGGRRDECIRSAQLTRGAVCCPQCAESPIGETHRGPR